MPEPAQRNPLGTRGGEGSGDVSLQGCAERFGEAVGSSKRVLLLRWKCRHISAFTVTKIKGEVKKGRVNAATILEELLANP